MVFFLSAAMVVLALSLRYVREGGFYQGEYYFLLLTAFLGCVLMPASRNLLMLFLALELVSAPGFAWFRGADSDIRLDAPLSVQHYAYVLCRMTVTGAAPLAWHGSEIAQPSRKFTTVQLRSSNALTL